MAGFFKDMFSTGSNAAPSVRSSKRQDTDPFGNAGSGGFFRDMLKSEPSTLKAETDQIATIPFQSAANRTSVETFLANQKEREAWREKGLGDEMQESEESERDFVELGLNEGYFADGFNPVEFVLGDLPEQNIGEREIFLIEQLDKLKSFETVVNKELLTIVQDHHAPLVDGMRQVQSIDLDVSRAVINVKNARRRLALAKEVLAKGDLEIVQLHRRRGRTKDMIEILENLDQIVKRKQEVDKAIEVEDFPLAVRQCVSVIDLLNSKLENGSRFMVLESMRDEMITTLPTLRKRTDESLRILCRSFSPEPSNVSDPVDLSGRFLSILQAYFLLDAAMESYTAESSSTKQKISHQSNFSDRLSRSMLSDGLVGFAPRIQRTVIEETERAIKEQLVAFLGDVDRKKRLASKALQNGGDEETNVSNGMDSDHLSSGMARGLSLKQICDKLPTREITKPSLMRRIAMGYEQITNILTIYHNITEWYKNLLDKANLEKEVSLWELLGLNKSGQSSPDDLETWETKSPTHSVERFAFGLKELESGRRPIWSGVLTHIATLCKSAALEFPALSLYAFENLVKLTDIMGIVGQVFGGDTCILEVRAFLRDLSKNYCKKFHRERVETLQNFLIREHWVMIHVPLESVGGKTGLVQRGMNKQLIRSSSLEEDDAISLSLEQAKSKSSVMENFAGEGNPFRSLTQVGECTGQPDDGDGPASFEMPEEDKGSPENGRSRVLSVGDSASAVLTTTVVNCVAKDIGSYLALMQRIPIVASEVLEKLKLLLYIYMYDIVSCFTPSGLLFEVFSRQNSPFAEPFSQLKRSVLMACEEVGSSTFQVKLVKPLQHKTQPTNTFLRGKSATVSKGQSVSGKASNAAHKEGGPDGVARVQLIPSAVPRSVIDLIGAERRSVDSSGVLTIFTARTGELRNIQSLNLVSRVIAGESVLFIMDLLVGAKDSIGESLPVVERMQLLGSTFSQIESTASQFRCLMHRSAARVLVNNIVQDAQLSSSQSHSSSTSTQVGGFDGVEIGVVAHAVVSTVQWDKIKTLQTEANSYVTRTVLQMRKVWAHLQRESKEGSVYPLAAISPVWYAALHECMDQLLDGFASVESCTTEGRALMLFDLATLYSGLEDIAPTGSETSERKLRVDDFVKAFYIEREQDIIEWISMNKLRYEHWHLRNLLRFGIGKSARGSTQLPQVLAALDRIYLQGR